MRVQSVLGIDAQRLPGVSGRMENRLQTLQDAWETVCKRIGIRSSTRQNYVSQHVKTQWQRSFIDVT